MQVSVPLPPPAVAPASAYASTSASPSGDASLEEDASSATVKVCDDIEADYPSPRASELDFGYEYSTFYFFVGFFAAALLLPFAFLFLLCPDSTGLVGRRRSAFVWGSAVGVFAGVGVVAVHFFVGYGIFVAWWMNKYDYI